MEHGIVEYHTYSGGQGYLIKDTPYNKTVRSSDYNFNFWKHNGHFMRWGETVDDDPNFSPIGPEILDIEISTGDCSGNCSWCYKASSPGDGKHMTLATFKSILSKFPKTLTQCALGLTDVDANPDLIPILQHCREIGIVPNFTTAGYGLAPALAKECATYVGAVAVSVYPHNIELAYDAVALLLDVGITQVNIHLLYYQENHSFVYRVMHDVQHDPRLVDLNAVVLLALKNRGRADSFSPMENREFESVVSFAMYNDVPLGFDSCSAHRFVKWVQTRSTLTESEKRQYLQMVEPCESGLFSAYVNVEGDFYPCSFVEGVGDWWAGGALLDCNNFLADIWYHPRTVAWRYTLLMNCRECPIYVI